MNVFDKALHKFAEAMKCCPLNPSPYNNRAQLLRMMGRIPGFLDAISDLDEALKLSNGKGTVAAKTYTQMGMINRLHGETEFAKENYKKAAELGSSFAKRQLVEMNPYSAMCNAMLSQVMSKHSYIDTHQPI